MTTADGPQTLGDAWNLRWPERHLLLWCMLCITIGFLMVLGAGHDNDRLVTAGDLLPLAVYGVSLVTVHSALVLCRFQGDQTLLAVVAFLAGFGLLAQYRMGSFDRVDYTALSNFVLPAGMAIMLATAVVLMRGRYHLLASGFWVWGALSLGLVAALLATGQRFRGGVYAVGFITPTEILKITVVLFLAGFIDRHVKALGRWGGKSLAPPMRGIAATDRFLGGVGGTVAATAGSGDVRDSQHRPHRHAIHRHRPYRLPHLWRPDRHRAGLPDAALFPARTTAASRPGKIPSRTRPAPVGRFCRGCRVFIPGGYGEKASVKVTPNTHPSRSRISSTR